MNCKDCISYAMCRSKILKHLREYYYEPFHFSQIYRAYFYEISIDCNVIYDKYKIHKKNYFDHDSNKIVEIVLEELSLGDLYVIM